MIYMLTAVLGVALFGQTLAFISLSRMLRGSHEREAEWKTMHETLSSSHDQLLASLKTTTASLVKTTGNLEWASAELAKRAA